MSGSGSSLVRSVYSVLLGCRIFFEHFKESLLFTAAAKLLEETGNHSAGDIVPERTHGRRQSRHRRSRKVHGSERDAQGRILHANFKAERLAFGDIHSKETAGEEAQSHAESILQRHHSENRGPAERN